MRILNASTMGQIEERADEMGKGSIWRACLAIQRSCGNDALGSLIHELAYGYCMGRDGVLVDLENICKDNQDATGEFKEAVQALKNAIEMAPKTKTVRSSVDDREGLWLRLDRVINGGQ